VRTSILLMACLVVGCVADVGDTTSTEQPSATDPGTPSRHLDVDKLTGAPLIKETDRDVCGLAAELPAGDLCAKMCDPDAMKAQLLDEGSQTGACYEFTCSLPDDSHVLVGVCLPPS
jgi:hypothetical protein